MSMISGLDPSAFFLEGGSTGILLLHGFTGAPTEMRLLGDYLLARGLTVSAPLLPGHGTTPDDLNNYCWNDWFNQAKMSLGELQTRCETVFVAGLSMGALLTLSLAATQPDIQGIATYAAAIDVRDPRKHLPGLMARLIPQLSKSEDFWADPDAESLCWSYDTWPTVAAVDLLKQLSRVKEQLSLVTCPFLAIYSSNDSTVTVEGIQVLYDSVSSTDKEIVDLNDSGHVITLDSSWEEAAEKSFSFINQRMPEGFVLG